jgi:hypothetical protein
MTLRTGAQKLLMRLKIRDSIQECSAYRLSERMRKPFSTQKAQRRTQKAQKKRDWLHPFKRFVLFAFFFVLFVFHIRSINSRAEHFWTR